MYSDKGINSEFKNPRESLSRMINHINANNCGFCLGEHFIKETYRWIDYVKTRQLPILPNWLYEQPNEENPYLAHSIFEAIKIAKEMQLKYFDFGGYAVTPDNQMIGINRFKSGFGGQIVQYPRKF